MFKGVSIFMDQVNFVYDEKGLSFGGMDASHVSLIDVAVSVDEWAEYRLKYGVSGSFGISLKQLVKVLSHTAGTDTVVFSYDSNSPKLTFDLDVRGKDRDFKVSLPTIDIDVDSLEIPSGLEYGF
jgi:DNA polymerase III sliding clamp (beta) subunit (PCNA family)